MVIFTFQADSESFMDDRATLEKTAKPHIQ